MKAYKDLNRKEKKAIDVTLEFWKYAKRTGKDKVDWKYFNVLKQYPFCCGVCLVAGHRGSDWELHFPIKEKCEKCFLFNEHQDTFCGYWDDWNNSIIIKERRKYAKIIYDKILAYVKGE